MPVATVLERPGPRDCRLLRNPPRQPVLKPNRFRHAEVRYLELMVVGFVVVVVVVPPLLRHLEVR